MTLTEFIISVTVSLLTLIYFAYDRIKYSNREIYHNKRERLNEINQLINAIQIENKEAMKLIETISFDTDLDDSLIDSLIKYNDNDDTLITLKKEQREIQKYFKKAHSYIKDKGYER
jgi:hypothetical protein